MTVRIEVVKHEGTTLSRMVWKLFRRKPAGYVERVLEATPGLASLPAVLPVGTRVVFPLDDVEPEAKSATVRLWD